MLFVETPIFTQEIGDLLGDDDYRALQCALALRPEAGPIIQGSGGLRKVRWGTRGRGKRGGLRIIYYWDKPRDHIFMIFAYRKARKDDLTAAQLKVLRKLVRENLA